MNNQRPNFYKPPTQPLKWHGGKHYLARKIIDMMPRHLNYVEPYCGGCSVLLNKDPYDERHQWGDKSHEQGISEVVNDVYGPLQNLWDVLKDPDSFAEFQRRVNATPFSEVEFERSFHRMEPKQHLDVEAALAFFTVCRQSRAGSLNSFTPVTHNRTRRRMNEQVSAWLNAVDGLDAVHKRLKRVLILCRDATDVIRQQDCGKTLFYLDPPYLLSTTASNGNYAHQMSKEQHINMLETILPCKGKVMLSGYPNELYDRMLDGWNRHDIEIDNKVSGAKKKPKVTESVWCNF